MIKIQFAVVNQLGQPSSLIFMMSVTAVSGIPRDQHYPMIIVLWCLDTVGRSAHTKPVQFFLGHPS